MTFTVTNEGVGPTIAIYDSFETGVAGAGMPNLTAGSYVGHWSTPTATGNGPVYSTAEAYAGSKSMMADMSLGANGGELYNSVDLSSTTQFMICEEWKLAGTGSWPGYCGQSINMKFDWTNHGRSTIDTDFYRGVNGPNTPDSCNPPNQWSLDGNDSTFTKFYTANTSTTSTASGSSAAWHPLCWWVNGLAPGDIRFIELGSTGTFRVAYTTTALTTPFLADAGNQNTNWTETRIPGFGRITVDLRWHTDDVYESTGPHAAAHIEITDSPNYFSSTKRAIFKSVSWTGSGTITAMAVRGPFGATDTVYAYVFNDGFETPVAGFQLTFGAAAAGGTSSGNSSFGINGKIIGSGTGTRINQ